MLQGLGFDVLGSRFMVCDMNFFPDSENAESLGFMALGPIL